MVGKEKETGDHSERENPKPKQTKLYFFCSPELFRYLPEAQGEGEVSNLMDEKSLSQVA